MEVHFVDVGIGNMTLLRFPSGSTFVYDCKIIPDNERFVLGYMAKAMGSRTKIDRFICSHRDSDHIRGIKTLHEKYPISLIEDADVPGTTTDSAEYADYMELRKRVGSQLAKPRTYEKIGDVTLRYMNGADDNMVTANDQSIVLKIEFAGSSALLTGDTSYRPWKDSILPYYPDERLSSSILLAPHHGSIGFFDDPANEKTYYTDHIKKIKPAMTIVSVGPNVHDLPDPKAIELYTKYSSGSNQGNKVFSTEKNGNMKLVLKPEGGWLLSQNQ